MKRFNLLVAVFAIVAANSCIKDNENIGLEPNAQKVSMTFLASQEAPTPISKTLLNEKSVNWQADDKIMVYTASGDANGEFSLVEGSNVDNPTSATFTGEIAAADNYHALYPSTGWAFEGGKYTFAGLAAQTAVVGSYDPAKAIAIATSSSDNSFSFQNAGALLKVTVAGAGVCSIKVTGTVENGSIGGKLAWNPGQIEMVSSESGADVISLSNSDNTPLENGSVYYIVVPAVTISNFAVYLCDSENNIIGEMAKVSAFNVERNKIYDLGALSYGYGRADWTMTCSQNPLPNVSGRNNSLTAMLDGNASSCFCITRPGKNSGGVNLTSLTADEKNAYEISFIIDTKKQTKINYIQIEHLSNKSSDRGTRLQKITEILGSNDGVDFTLITDQCDFTTHAQVLNNVNTGTVAIPESNYRYYKFLMRGIDCYDPGAEGTDGSSNTGNTCQIKEFYLGNKVQFGL